MLDVPYSFKGFDYEFSPQDLKKEMIYELLPSFDIKEREKIVQS